MTLTNPRTHYKPFDYPWAYEYFKAQNQIHWLAEEVPLSDDVHDWKFKLSEQEINLVTQILRFFTQGDVDMPRGTLRNT